MMMCVSLYSMKSLHNMAAITICSPFLLLMLQTLIGLPSVQSNTPLMATIEVASTYHEMVVTINCDGVPEGETPSFFNRVGQNIREVTVVGPGSPGARQYVIELNVSTEGYYFCEAGNQHSNEVLLVGELWTTLK